MNGLLNGEECVLAGVLGCVEELLLDAQKLIVLADTVGAGRCAGLYLTCVQTYNDICDSSVFCLSASVRNYCSVSCLLRHLDSVECPYCDTHDRKVLSQVLNDYDLETQDFHRWEVRYSQSELSDIVRDRSGIDFGRIIELRPVKRGPSYRIYELEIVGTKRRMIVGKELEIRKWLSRTHLYSSAFDVSFTPSPNCGDGEFVLRGRGWGHGVGLCQIGAAVMADKGFTYEQILAHYFPHSTLKTL